MQYSTRFQYSLKCHLFAKCGQKE